VSQNNTEKTTILVVEDDMHLMEGIHDILEINGYKVLTATNGAAGLELLREQPLPPDLIVSDIMMPRMDGYQFFQAVQADKAWEDIPFIFLTAKGEREDIHFGKKLGVDDYVVKPFDAEDLLVAVEAKLSVANKRRKRREAGIEEIKHQILTILNHEFRTPLTYIVAYADMAHRDAENLNPDEMNMFLRGINTGANRLRRLVETFILMVELITGEAQKTFEYRRRRIDDYEGLVRLVETKYQDLAAEKGVTLNVFVDSDLPPMYADHEYLGAALECLVDNAIKFSDKAGAQVIIRVCREDNQVCFKVRDFGRGIAAADLPHIFEPFYQIKRERYEDQGAGSGLAIVRGVVQLHHGSVDAYSEFGKGTEMVMRLPVI